MTDIIIFTLVGVGMIIFAIWLANKYWINPTKPIKGTRIKWYDRKASNWNKEVYE